MFLSSSSELITSCVSACVASAPSPDCRHDKCAGAEDVMCKTGSCAEFGAFSIASCSVVILTGSRFRNSDCRPWAFGLAARLAASLAWLRLYAEEEERELEAVLEEEERELDAVLVRPGASVFCGHRSRLAVLGAAVWGV